MNISKDRLFFSLLRAGLWGEPDPVADYSHADWNSVFGLAREQTVVGLVADGISVVKRSGIPIDLTAEVSRKILVQTIGIERSNARLDKEVAELAGLFNNKGICYCLVKGQGTALNYPNPRHRSPGDIDFLLDAENYHLASEVLAPKADKLFPENPDRKHLAMLFHDEVEVELHGTVRADFGKKFNAVIDSVQEEFFTRKDFRSWHCQGESVTLPSVDFDAIYIFTHFVNHFYHSGLGLRQICDWTMHLHRFASVLDKDWIKRLLEDLDLNREWKAFGFVAVNLLGLPREEMPFYDENFGRYSDTIWASIRHSGNFGRTMNGGRDLRSEPYLLRKIRSMQRHLSWMSRHLALSPHNTFRSIRHTLSHGFSAVMKRQ